VRGRYRNRERERESEREQKKRGRKCEEVLVKERELSRKW